MIETRHGFVVLLATLLEHVEQVGVSQETAGCWWQGYWLWRAAVRAGVIGGATLDP